MKFRLFQIFSAFLLFSASFAVYSQTKPTEIDVQILRSSGGKEFYCTAENGVISETDFDKIISQKQCSGLETLLNVDFETESLISFRARGDCHLQAHAKVFRSDEAKKYFVKVEKTNGGCRAAGNHQGWLVVDKLKPDYTVEFVEKTIERMYNEWNVNDVKPFIKSIQNVESKPFDLKGCIQTFSNGQFAIKTQNEFLKALRKDASLEWCLQNLEKIDFEKNSLIGMGITSDYCDRPAGLEYKIVQDSENKNYLFSVSYLETKQLCRRIGHYDLWLLTPKLDTNYPIKFELKTRPHEN
ncbi:MAG TPA: hypothetical protein PKY59_02255 [Pyrinomonadaceae bacterium]|nr:hypothetical protein [Pyrinomonadaceae bacterium]